MRYRKLSPTGDYTFGQGQANFWINSPNGVGQSVKTRLLLWQGEWFLDQTDGTPYATEVLGYQPQSLRDTAIRQRVLSTVGVTGIVAYASSVNPATRKMTITNLLVQTQYSANPVQVAPVVVP